MKRSHKALDTDSSPGGSSEIFRSNKRIAVSPTARYANLRLPSTSPQQSNPAIESESAYTDLPVFKNARQIVAAVNENDVTIIVGDTGCGKTTGVPQILFKNFLQCEKRRPKIVVTQPRVVAATSIAKRVAEQVVKDRELLQCLGPQANLNLGGIVGYRVRFDDKTSKDTCLQYATDGLLIREILFDVTKNDGDERRLFSKYNYVIIDEAHERTLRIDELLGLTKIALKRRKHKFKVIIMSATLDIETLQSFYKSEEIRSTTLSIPGRAFPVEIKYLKSPCEDYIEACISAACQIMLTSSTGDILIFLPGSDDIKVVCRRLQDKYAELQSFKRLVDDLSRFLCALRAGNLETRASLLAAEGPEELKHLLLKHFGMDYISQEELSAFARCAERVSVGSTLDIIVQYKYEDAPSLPQKEQEAAWLQSEWTILPLFSQLSYDEQQKVFVPPKLPTHRKIIIATNIAETSITLPRICYVVDSGKVKQKYNATLKLADVSVAMSNQRCGRAGRVQSGVAYRLYTEEHFHQLPLQAIPEIGRCDLAELLLDLKAIDGKTRRLSTYLKLSKDSPLDIRAFPFPTLPSSDAISDAELLLKRLGACESVNQLISTKGQKLSALPLPVLLANLVLESIDRGCLAEILIIAAMLSLDVEWFPQAEEDLAGSSKQQGVIAKRRRILHPTSDHLGLLNLYNCWSQAIDRHHFCRIIRVEERHLRRARHIRDQLAKLLLQTPIFEVKDIRSVLKHVEDSDQIKTGLNIVRECLAFGLFFNVAVRRDDMKECEDKASVVYVSVLNREKLLLHPSSTFFTLKSQRPECIVYSSTIETEQRYAKGVTAIENDWFLKIQSRIL